MRVKEKAINSIDPCVDHASKNQLFKVYTIVTELGHDSGASVVVKNTCQCDTTKRMPKNDSVQDPDRLPIIDIFPTIYDNKRSALATWQAEKPRDDDQGLCEGEWIVLVRERNNIQLLQLMSLRAIIGHNLW